MSQPYAVVLGPPAAGKSTQARRLADEFDVELVDVGEVLRANEAMETEFGTPAEYIERGELVPDPVTNEVVGEVLTGTEGAVLDGYPRTLGQAAFLDGIAELDVAVFLDASEETVLARATSRRVCEECGEEYRVPPDASVAGLVPSDTPEAEGECDECGATLVRPDDATPAFVEDLLAEYRAETAEVVEFYRQRGLLTEVDAEQSPDEVWRDVRDAVASQV
ncbi:nucleoside monophosphate kinase [Halorussus sp. MSC15.2]|uniref:nucleoside monophosphate kinase n=1 Tax=Halorussus sp. MSC15.2 TaxID=2283638 RepID=UPI0013CFB8D1|nr:nucleoside monophosphate kinase [Halorussus sp. MSC15.2]NEU57925.1 AAA family ATPase [Halorussus sp. MSC15.2]